MPKKTFIEKIISGVGSVSSLLIHSILFSGSFILSIFDIVPWSMMLLVLTTIVSLEAIYLAIFIQMSVNRQARELAEVSEDVDEIQEDIEEISQDVDEIQKDVDEIQEDVEEINEEEIEEETQEKQQTLALEQLTADVRQLLADLEQLKKRG